MASVSLDDALAAWRSRGWARLGGLADVATVEALRASVDDLMQRGGAGLFFQHDAATGRYQDLVTGAGWVGPSSAYRKIEGVERDPAVRAWIEAAPFAAVARAVIDGPVALTRAVIWTKAAAVDGGGGGTELPWHQDGGRFWGLTAQPPLTIWTALDDAPVEAGCIEVVSGSHAAGLATPEGGTIPEALVAGRVVEHVPARAGEVLLLHNLVWHRSGRNRTRWPRRALSFTLMPASTRCTRTRRAPRQFMRLYEPA